MAQLKSTNILGNLVVNGSLLFSNFAKLGGTSSQILMADGSVTTTADLLGSTYPKFIQTRYKDSNNWYNTSYPIYAQWETDSICKWKIDNYYTKVDYANIALKLMDASTITLTGDVTGTFSFDGSGDVSVTTTVADSSHYHNASNINAGTLSSDRLPTVPIAKGGTGATTAAAALTNLGFSGAVTTIISSNLTASRALISNSNGKVAVSAVTATELGYLSSVTSPIQTQLNAKVNSTDCSSAGNRASGKIVTAAAAGQINSDKYLVTSSGTGKVTLQYNTTYKALEFSF